MAGLLAGAMMGLGQGVNEAGNFLLRAKADEIKEARLQKYEMAREQRQNQRQDKIRGEDRSWQQEDYQMQRSDAVEDRDFNADMTRWQVNTTQNGANSRAAMQINASREQGRNDWQLVPDGKGGYGRYSPSRNEWGQANLPPGTDPNGGNLTDSQKAQLNMLENQAKPLREKMADGMPLTPEEKTTLGRIESDAQTILTPNQQGMTPFQQLMQGEGGNEEEAPAASPDSIPGQVRQQQEQQRNTQEANQARREASQARDAADDIIKRIEREAAGGASRGGLLAGINKAAGRGEVSQEAMAEAQQVAQQILALDQNPNISADEKRWLSERLIRLQEAGVPLNLDQ